MTRAADDPFPAHFIEAKQFRTKREQREQGQRKQDHVANPLSDRALKLGRWSEPESAAARRQRIARERRLDMILSGLSPEEIKQREHGKRRHAA